MSTKNIEKQILSDAELKGEIDFKLSQSLSMNFNSTTLSYRFDQLSTLESLFDHLKPLIHSPQPMLNDLIKKTCHLLIDTFMSWFRSLSFSSLLNKTLHSYLIQNHWSKYLLFVLCYFLTEHTFRMKSISRDDYLRRVFEYQQTNNLSLNSSPSSGQIIQTFLNFLSQFSQLNLSQSEFTLLSILLVIRPGKQKSMLNLLFCSIEFFFPPSRLFRFVK